MTIWHERLPHTDAYLVGVSGRLDQSLNPELEETLNQLLENGHSDLIVDLSRTTYINSGGLRCLVSAWRRARSANGALRLCGLNPRLQEIFAMVGFDKVFEIHPNCDEARSMAKRSRS